MVRSSCTPAAAAAVVAVRSAGVRHRGRERGELADATTPGKRAQARCTMTSLAWLIPAALFLGLLGLAAFLWALKDGQFEDLEGAGWRAIDDAPPAEDKQHD